MDRGARHLAVLFPGQGVGSADSRELVHRFKPNLLATAEQMLGGEVFGRIRESTRFAQPAVYCAGLAAYERLGRPHAGMLAGHSLGEIVALVAAGAIDEHDGLRIVVERGRLMDLAAEGVAGGMLALGVGNDAAAEIARRHGLTVANDNSPEQVVLSGSEPGLAAAERQARADGLRVKRLRIAGPFHTDAMAPVVEPFRQVLAEIPVRPPTATVFSCITAAPFEVDPRDALALALVRPVRWVEVLRRLRAEGARRFIDVGPGRVLAGLVRRTLDDVAVDPPPVAEPIGA
jgi:malonyl CoA-acyl carrier protein transacylase